jgi:Leucine-rich repeat (LRR) protein
VDFEDTILSLDDFSFRKVLAEVWQDHNEAFINTGPKVQEKLSHNISKRNKAIFLAKQDEYNNVKINAPFTAFSEQTEILNKIREMAKEEKSETTENVGFFVKEKRFENIKPATVNSTIKRIEEAIQKKEILGLGYFPLFGEEQIESNTIKKALDYFKNRKEELSRIKGLSIDMDDIESAKMLFEIGAIEYLDINGFGNSHNTELPIYISNCVNLKTLEINYNNSLRTIPAWIVNLKSLEHFVFKGTSIRDIPDWLGSFASLIELDLSENKILDSIPDSICSLKNLRKLNLNSNNIAKLPEDIGCLKHLENLDIKGSNIESLPESIGNLLSLITMDCSGNKIKTLPKCITNLTVLKKLDANNNIIQRLPNDFGNLASLEKLDLSNNPIKIIPVSMRNLENLAYFNLSSTKIDKFPGFLAELPSLKVLELINSKIYEKDIPEKYRERNLADAFNDHSKYDRLHIFYTVYPKIIYLPEHSMNLDEFEVTYYKVVLKIMELSEIAKHEGLLALELNLDELGDEYFKIGIQLVVDGNNADAIIYILSNFINREHDPYKKKLKEIILEGILAIQAGRNVESLILSINSTVNIANDLLTKACGAYLNADLENYHYSLELMKNKEAPEEREEVKFIKRVMWLSEKARRQGLLSLEDDLDADAVAFRDVFEYGMLMVIDNITKNTVELILSNLIIHETDHFKKNMDKAKMGAVMSIRDGDNPRIAAIKLSSYFDDNIRHIIDELYLKD